MFDIPWRKIHIVKYERDELSYCETTLLNSTVIMAIHNNKGLSAISVESLAYPVLMNDYIEGAGFTTGIDSEENESHRNDTA